MMVTTTYRRFLPFLSFCTWRTNCSKYASVLSRTQDKALCKVFATLIFAYQLGGPRMRKTLSPVRHNHIEQIRNKRLFALGDL